VTKIFNLGTVFLILLILLTTCTKEDESGNPEFLGEGIANGFYFPTTDWKECAPEEVGMSSEKLKAVYDYCADDIRKTDAFIVIKDGYIVAEYYFNKNTISTFQPSYSIAKAFVASLTGVAIKKGYINGVDDKIADYFPQLQGDNVQPEKNEISIKHLLTMTSGIQWNEEELLLNGDNDLLSMRTGSTNFVNYVLNKPVIDTPGTVWNYSSGMPVLLAGLIENATGQLAFDFAKDNLFNSLGITNIEWASDPEGHTIGAWGILTTVRNYAKLGYLYLNNGIWDGTRLLPEYWVSDSYTPPLENYPQFGYMFWTAQRYPNDIDTRIPEETYMAVGLFQKYIVIIPSKNMILVRFGNDAATGELGWDTAEFISLAVDAVN